MYDIAIIGAGIVGTFIARELAKFQLKIIVFEKENDVANGATGGNSGIIYESFHSNPDKLKGKLISRGNELYEQVCKQLDVPLKTVGSHLIGFDEEDLEVIKKTYKKAIKCGVSDVKILNKEETLQMEPYLNPEVNYSLYSPTCRVISPFEMAIALAENAVDNGVELLLNSQVTKINKLEHGFEITAGQQLIKSLCVINCAGIYADEINGMIASDAGFTLEAKRGQYVVLDQRVGSIAKSVITQCKKEDQKGVMLIPTVHNHLMIGPIVEGIEEKDGNETTAQVLGLLEEKVRKTTDQIPPGHVIHAYSGINAKTQEGDFYIKESEEAKGFINVAGINTPGLTCAPAIAELVVSMVHTLFLREEKKIEKNTSFYPERKKVYRFKELSDWQKEALIQKDCSYGRVVCRCETITEGEIIDAIHRHAGAQTVKGVKKRTSATMGRCQGGFCGPKIVEILARELGKEMWEVTYDSPEAFVLVEN